LSAVAWVCSGVEGSSSSPVKMYSGQREVSIADAASRTSCSTE
jgi:hypothetical protein